MAKIRTIETLQFDGGTLCFDFINTVYAWRGENLHEYFNNYNDFIRWSERQHLLPNVTLKRMEQQVSEDKKAAIRTMNKIWKARKLLYNFFSSIAAKDYNKIKDYLPDFNKIIAEGMSGILFKVKSKRLLLTHEGIDIDPLQPLWMVFRSAFDMLTKEDIEKIKECPKCGWIFLDRTKNGKRKWCNPSDCGSTDKMKRYYLRKKKSND